MKLKDIMTTHVATIGPDNSVLDASKRCRLTILVLFGVPAGRQVIGIVTDRDIVVRNIANEGIENNACKALMTEEVISANPSMDVEEACDLMARHKIRGLPVVQNDRIVNGLNWRFGCTVPFTDEAGEALANFRTFQT